MNTAFIAKVHREINSSLEGDIPNWMKGLYATKES